MVKVKLSENKDTKETCQKQEPRAPFCFRFSRDDAVLTDVLGSVPVKAPPGPGVTRVLFLSARVS